MVLTTALALVVAGWRRPGHRLRLHRSAPPDEMRFAATVAAELRAGRSLRHALEEAIAGSRLRSDDVMLRGLEAGLPLGDVADRLEAALPQIGRAVAAAVQMAATSGGAVAPLFDRIAEQRAAASEIERERRAATAQIRFSALVVGVLPLALTLVLLISGRLSSTLGGGSFGIAVVGAGAGLQVLGLAVIGLLIRRAV